MQRNPSTTSVRMTTTSSAASNSSAKKSSRAKDLLRDYYGLTSPPSEKSQAASLGLPAGNPLDLDSPSFSAKGYMQNLLSTSTLPQLLRTSTELSASVSELESERQSLVYNHHHELIDASITISKMKVRAESLDTTLEQLKAGLAKCSELDNGLREPAMVASEASPNKEESVVQPDWQLVLGTVLDLPLTMQAASSNDAQRLWGTYEPVLRRWKDAGVQGIADVESDCRDILDIKCGAGYDSISPQIRRRSGSTMTIRP